MTAGNAEPEAASDFLRSIIAEDAVTGRFGRKGGDTVSSRAQRLHAHRPRQVGLDQLRAGRGERRSLPPSVRRHQSSYRGPGVRRGVPAGHPVAGVRLGRAPLLHVRLLREAVRVRRTARRGGQGLRMRSEPGGDQGLQRHPDRARQGQPLPRQGGGCQSRPPGPHEGGRVRRGLAGAPRQDRHGLRQPEHARPRSLPDSEGPAPPHRRQLVHLSHLRLRGTASPTPSRASPTRSARRSSKTTGRCTTGSSNRSASTAPGRSSSQG